MNCWDTYLELLVKGHLLLLSPLHHFRPLVVKIWTSASGGSASICDDAFFVIFCNDFCWYRLNFPRQFLTFAIWSKCTCHLLKALGCTDNVLLELIAKKTVCNVLWCWHRSCCFLGLSHSSNAEASRLTNLRWDDDFSVARKTEDKTISHCMKLLHIVAEKAQFRIAHLVPLHNIFTYSPGEPGDSVKVWCCPWSQDAQQLLTQCQKVLLTPLCQ